MLVLLAPVRIYIFIKEKSNKVNNFKKRMKKMESSFPKIAQEEFSKAMK